MTGFNNKRMSRDRVSTHPFVLLSEANSETVHSDGYWRRRLLAINCFH